MKKLLISIILFMAMAGSAMAQDLIVTRDGRDIQAKVVEVTAAGIRYLDFENQNGPTYTLNKSDVALIRYQNGKNEVFPMVLDPEFATYRPYTDSLITEGMSYWDYRKIYDYNRYNRRFGDVYNPSWAGVASFFVPGLGQAVCGELGTAACFFGVDLLGAIAIAVILPNAISNYHKLGFASFVPMTLISGVMLFNEVFSIVDAVHVAKIKNMYYQDLHYQDLQKRQASVGFSVSPCLTTVNAPGANGPAMGLSLNLSF